MAAIKACCKTSLGFEQGCEQLTALTELGETIARYIETSHMGDCTNEENLTDETGEDAHANRVEQDVTNELGDEPRAPPVPNGIQISECAPKEARTKDRKRGGKQVVNDEASTSSRSHVTTSIKSIWSITVIFTIVVMHVILQNSSKSVNDILVSIPKHHLRTVHIT
ncbi:hypothetical protein BAE44_0020271 [Dichanthelium oligosanthes]|uniref:Uncharacterized protein n=1 Tax=Dichanthelium oligosanthes TaxID=888268 RepID=A0A1E5V0R5_9POAL|nr:hypothetical protein BAE44_0020271 [Dichanthelium oligosanthes]